MKAVVILGSLLLGVLIGVSARADLRALDEAELKELGRFAATELRSCPGWDQLRELAGPTILNKTSEHLDKKVLSAELVSRLGDQIHWIDSGDAPSEQERVAGVELQLGSAQLEGAQRLESVYELKIDLKGGGLAECHRSVRLEKRVRSGTGARGE